LFVAIAIEAFNKLGTVDEDQHQVRPMERQPSDPRPSTTDVCSIPFLIPSRLSYKPIFLVSVFWRETIRLSIVTLVWGLRRTSLLSSRSLVELCRSRGTLWNFVALVSGSRLS